MEENKRIKENVQENQYKEYIGMPLFINAKAMNLGEYYEYRGWMIPENENFKEEGYLIVYSDTKIKGWSSKENFEKEYKLLEDLKLGK